MSGDSQITPITFEDVENASRKIYTKGITETNLQVSSLVLTCTLTSRQTLSSILVITSVYLYTIQVYTRNYKTAQECLSILLFRSGYIAGGSLFIHFCNS